LKVIPGADRRVPGPPARVYILTGSRLVAAWESTVLDPQVVLAVTVTDDDVDLIVDRLALALADLHAELRQ
jgi:hypothetical protein